MKKRMVPSSARAAEGTNTRRTFPSLCGKLLLLALICSLSAFAQQNEDANQSGKPERTSQLRVSGTVTSMRILEDDNAVKVRLAVNLVAENTGQENLILLRRAPVANTEYLFTAPTGGQPLWVLPHPSSPANGVQNHKPETLKTGLDQKEPPQDYTITLNPGDSIGWDIPLELQFMKKVEPREIQVGTPPRPVWDVITKSCPCWLKLDLDLWPMSIEPKSETGDPALARKLSVRWKKKGTLIYAEKRTEGIALKLQPATR
ncbi:MAG TPA: hypothetical protein VJV96_06200 [Candidatus Angelobacter sp.]|nr:hypothetical protein [Candidatus Angelobacter sp.]